MTNHAYELSMPFVACKTQGGTYDDTSFVAGYRLGSLAARLKYEKPDMCRGYVYPADMYQLDLIAMRAGYIVMSRKHSEGWIFATLRKVEGA